MTDRHDHEYEYYRVWFNRVGRGIALVGPLLILLIILATFVTRMFHSPEDSEPGEEVSGTTERTGDSAQVKPAGPGTGDGLTTPTASVLAEEAESP